MEQVAQSLIKKQPCRTEKGSSSGYDGWKMTNYRTQLRKLGRPEVTVNSLKNKPVGKHVLLCCCFFFFYIFAVQDALVQH